MSAAWKTDDWDRVIELSLEQLSWACSQPRRTTAFGNSVGAFQNKALVPANEGNWPAACAVLRNCLEKLPTANVCREALDKMISEHTVYQTEEIPESEEK